MNIKLNYLITIIKFLLLYIYQEHFIINKCVFLKLGNVGI